MTFRRYGEYKDSGLPWIGRLPVHWQSVPLRHVATCLDGCRVPLNAVERSAMKGQIPYWGANCVVDYVDRSILDEPVVLLGEDGAPFFDRTKPVAFYSEGPIWPNNHIHVLRPAPAVLGQFLVHALNSTDYAAFIQGSTRDKLTQSAMAAIPIPLPGVDEQAAVVEFLHRETTKIDALVEEQKRLIGLLREKRQAVILQAVTKGLDSDVPMKSSGVEWLGEVPAHWQLSRLANLYSDTDERGNDELPVLTVSIHDGVSDDELDEAELDRKVTRSDDKTKYKRVQAGDLVYNMMRAWQGGFGTVTVDGMVSPAYVVARPRTPFPTAFIESILRTPNAIEEMRGRSRGVTDFRLRLYWEEFKEIVVPLPPKDEVEAILGRLARLNAHYAGTIDAAEDCIAILGERRSALVSAAVTGKIDVRGLAPQPGGAIA